MHERRLAFKTVDQGDIDMYRNDYAGAIEKWKVELIVSRAKRLGLRRQDLEDAQQQIVIELLSFQYDAARSNGASEKTVVTSIIDHQLFNLLRNRQRYEQRVARDEAIRDDDPTLARDWRDGAQLIITSDVQTALAHLSPTAREVCTALSEGLSLHQVARRLGLGWHTVHEHVRHIRRCFEQLDIDHLVTT